MSDDEEEYDYLSQDDEEDFYSEHEVEVKENVKATTFDIPDAGYKIVDYKEIYPMMESLITEISSLLDVDRDVTQLLLQKFKWNKERLVNGYYSDPEAVLVSAGVTPNASDLKIPPSANKCRICFEENPSLIALQCGHGFCETCYSQYLQVNVGDGPQCVHCCCPELHCKLHVPHSLFSRLCEPDVYEKYRMYLIRNFIETCSYIRWCPSANCQHIAIGSGITTVLCNACNLPYCFKCGEESHDPCQCNHLAMWKEKCSNESETANWILVNTKRCPQCNVRIEKNQGCNHMTCKHCKFEFCWVCLGDWKEHNQNSGGYYKCNKYDKKTNADVQKAQAELDRYLHYYKRYHAHYDSLKFASKQREAAEAKMVELQSTEHATWVDVQFLKQAVEQVIECRRVLKYSYVLGHYLPDHTMEKELFEYHQELLETHTEKLSEYTEMTHVENIDRTTVINLTRVTEKFMHSILTNMMEGAYNSPAVGVTERK